MHKYKIVHFVQVQLAIVPTDRQTNLKLDTWDEVKAYIQKKQFQDCGVVQSKLLTQLYKV